MAKGIRKLVAANRAHSKILKNKSWKERERERDEADFLCMMEVVLSVGVGTLFYYLLFMYD